MASLDPTEGGSESQPSAKVQVPTGHLEKHVASCCTLAVTRLCTAERIGDSEKEKFWLVEDPPGNVTLRGAMSRVRSMMASLLVRRSFWIWRALLIHGKASQGHEKSAF